MERSRPQKHPCNLVMITLDCVRPDHLGCYGYKGVETSHLDHLASNGILFEQAVTHAPNTWVAHATLLTGCLPSRHGLRAATNRLSSQVVTLAEWLSSHGYETAGFPGNSLVGKAQGFDRGFALFHEPGADKKPADGQPLWQRDWRHVLQVAGDWVMPSREPFFLWFHYVETHHLPEFDLPKYFRRSFSSRWQHYDGKISYADQVCIGEVLGLLEKRGQLNRTIFTVFSDHGEELHPDGRVLHDGGLKDDVIRVPLVLWLPPEKTRGCLRVSEQVGLMDLFPTACDLLDLPRPTGMQGHSLLPSVMGQYRLDDEAAVAYLENWPKGYLGLRTQEWKLILQHPRPEDWGAIQPGVHGLYHLPTDPHELLDLSGRHPSVLQHLRSLCIKCATETTPMELEPEERAHVERLLEGLGYL